MTTIALPASPVRTRLRLTARGRHVLAAIIALPVAAAIGMAALGGGDAAASGHAASGSSFQTVTVAAGDSLWSIARTVAPSADPRDVVGEIVRLNALDGAAITPGQRLAIPTAYAPAH